MSCVECTAKCIQMYFANRFGVHTSANSRYGSGDRHADKTMCIELNIISWSCECIDIETNYNRIANPLCARCITKVIRVKLIHNCGQRKNRDGEWREWMERRTKPGLGCGKHFLPLFLLLSLRCDPRVDKWKNRIRRNRRPENKMYDHQEFMNNMDAKRRETYFHRVPT